MGVHHLCLQGNPPLPETVAEHGRILLRLCPGHSSEQCFDSHRVEELRRHGQRWQRLFQEAPGAVAPHHSEGSAAAESTSPSVKAARNNRDRLAPSDRRGAISRRRDVSRLLGL